MSSHTKPGDRILVTGSAGAVGWAVCKELTAKGYIVRGLDRKPTPDDVDLHESVVADLSDANALRDAMADCAAVIHLAANPNQNSPFLPKLCDANIIGLYNTMEAAREVGIKRIVLTSSVMASMGHPWRQRVVTMEDGPAPEYHYALTKVYAEQMGEMYHRVHGMDIIVIRLGWYLRGKRELERVDDRSKSIYLSTVDAGNAFRLSIEADASRFGGYAVFFITSRHVTDNGFDLDPANRAIGYEPQDEFPENLDPHLDP